MTESRPRLVRGYYLSRTCLVRVSYEEGYCLNWGRAISRHFRFLPPPELISLLYSELRMRPLTA